MKLYGAIGGSSRELLAWAVQHSHQLAPLPSIQVQAGGKPFFPAHPQLHFSLSHSRELILCALDTQPVGVDIEWIRPRRATLPAYVLSPPEYHSFQLLGGDWPAFYTLWTKKEAWCKYTGLGLGKSLRKTPAEEGLFYRHYAGEGWCASICGRSEPPPEICWLSPRARS